MRPHHAMLALLLVTIWGANFIAIKVSLVELPPFLLCAVRFFFAAIPAVFFIKRPAVPFRMIVLYGTLTFALQFGLLFTGMSLGMPPGLTSLVLQVQLFFSLFFALFFLKETLQRHQLIGCMIALLGIVLVVLTLNESTPLSSFLLVIAAAAAWGGGNLIAKKIPSVNALALVSWGSLVAFLPLMFVSLLIDGPVLILHSLSHLSRLGFASTAYIVYLSTLVGYGAWNWLLNRYTVATIVPFALLVPVIGMLTAALVFKESIQTHHIMAACCVLIGLSINLFGSRWIKQDLPESKKSILSA